MSLPRRDIRVWFHPNVHKAIAELAALSGVDNGVYCEEILVPIIARRVHVARLIAERTQGLELPPVVDRPDAE